MSGGVPKRISISRTQSNTPSKAGNVMAKKAIVLCNGRRARRAMCHSIQTRANPRTSKPKSEPAGPALTPTTTMTSGQIPTDNLIGFYDSVSMGALAPNNIVSPTEGNLTIKSMRYVNSSVPSFNLEIQYSAIPTPPATATVDISSITLINCDNGAKITYNTNALGTNAARDGSYTSAGSTATWVWIPNQSVAPDPQEKAFWEATVGKSIKVIFEFAGGPSVSKTVSDYCVDAPTYTPPTGGPIIFKFGLWYGVDPVTASAPADPDGGGLLAGRNTVSGGGSAIGSLSPLPDNLPGNELRQINEPFNAIVYTYNYDADDYNLFVNASNGLGPNPSTTTPFSSIKFTIETGPSKGTTQTYAYGDFTAYDPPLGLPKVTVRKWVQVQGTFETFWKNTYGQTVSIEVTP